MTLILTAISEYGIIHSTDPRLSTYPRHVTVGRRVFALGFADAALSVTEGYEIGGEVLRQASGGMRKQTAVRPEVEVRSIDAERRSTTGRVTRAETPGAYTHPDGPPGR
jgi:hypothetical protein